MKAGKFEYLDLNMEIGRNKSICKENEVNIEENIEENFESQIEFSEFEIGYGA